MKEIRDQLFIYPLDSAFCFRNREVWRAQEGTVQSLGIWFCVGLSTSLFFSSLIWV